MASECFRTYDSLINDIPDLTVIDNEGQNAIHQLALHNLKYQSDLLYKFDNLIKNGCELDHKDNHGKTALHKATSLCNYQTVDILLSLGADINIKDDEGKVPYDYEAIHDSRRTKQIFMEHIRKLKLAEVDVDNLNEVNIYYDFSKLNCIKEEKQRLDVKLKEEISPTFCVNYFFSQQFTIHYWRMPAINRQAICNFCDFNNVHKQYPELASFIMSQYRKAQLRTRLLEPASASLRALACIALPELCLESIFKYLTNDDMMNLIRADNGKLELLPLPNYS